MTTLNTTSPALGGSFLPAEYVRGKVEQRTNLICLGLFISVMVGVVAAFMVTNRSSARVREEKLAMIEEYGAEAKRFDQLKALESQRTKMREKAEITASLIESVPRSVLLGELVLRLPEGLKLTDITLKTKKVEAPPAPKAPNGATTAPKSLEDKAKEQKAALPPAPKFEQHLTLIGAASTNNAVADYVRSIRDCSLFASVELAFIKETMVHEQELRQFQIDAVIRSDADGRALAPSVDERFKKLAADLQEKAHPGRKDKPQQVQVVAEPPLGGKE